MLVLDATEFKHNSYPHITIKLEVGKSTLTCGICGKTKVLPEMSAKQLVHHEHENGTFKFIVKHTHHID